MLDQWKKLRNEERAKRLGIKIIDHEKYHSDRMGISFSYLMMFFVLVVLMVAFVILVNQHDVIITKVAAYCMEQNMTLTECAAII